MEEFNYEMHYIKGQNNTHADFLSRNFQIKGKDTCTNEPDALDYSWIRNSKRPPRKIKRGDIKETLRIYVQSRVHKLYETSKRYLIVRRMKEEIIKICKTGKICMEEKGFKKTTENVLDEYHTNAVNETIAADIKDPITTKT